MDDKVEKVLIGVRSEMMAALDTFYSHVRFTLTLMTTILGAGLALISYAIQNEMLILHVMAGILLASVFLISAASIRIVRRYFKIYASNYIYAAQLHTKYGEVSHPWIEDLLRHQSITDLESPDAVEQFIEAKNSSDKPSWVYYKTFIFALGLAGPVMAFASILATNNA